MTHFFNVLWVEVISIMFLRNFLNSNVLLWKMISSIVSFFVHYIHIHTPCCYYPFLALLIFLHATTTLTQYTLWFILSNIHNRLQSHRAHFAYFGIYYRTCELSKAAILSSGNNWLQQRDAIKSASKLTRAKPNKHERHLSADIRHASSGVPESLKNKHIHLNKIKINRLN